MTFDQIMRDLKNRIYRPIYFLMGEEPYYIDTITKYISENVLEESQKSFNQTVIYGKDTDVATLDNISRRYPMMSDHQVIIVKEAQNLKKIENLVHYASQPSKQTILVLNFKYKKLAKNTKLYKQIDKNGIVFESKKLYENQIPKWINNYLKDKDYTISPEAERILTEFLGTDLGKIANELNKLIITLPKGTAISTDHIEQNIGISKDYNNFELQKAVGERDVLKVNRIINHFGKNQKDTPFMLTNIALYSYFTKILKYHYLRDKSRNNAASTLGVNPYFLNDYVSASKKYGKAKLIKVISVLREYDLKSKGVNNTSTEPAGLLKEMMYKIMH